MIYHAITKVETQMTILELMNIRKSFGDQKILDRVSWQINSGEKIALVGLNGSGKTTLLRLIKGEILPDEGEIRYDSAIRIGYVPQIARFDENNTLREEICDEDILKMRREMRELESEMSSLKDDSMQLAKIVDRYGKLQAEFQNRDGYRYDSRLEIIINKVGFSHSDLDKPVSTLSGGEKSRAKLAKALLKQPDVLLLDEPDNHLDVSTIQWLEEFISDYRGTVIIVSHDRYLLDKVANKTLELEFGKLRQYNGNYSYYADQKDRSEVVQHYEYVTQQHELARLKEVIETLKLWGDRGNNPKFGRRARSMEKTIERMELVDKPRKKAKMQLALDFQKRSGEMVIEAVGISKKFGEKDLFSNINLNIRWGEHVAIVGPNGSGKTTLIKILLGLEQPTKGHVNLGENLLISYFDQEQRGLNNQKTIYDEIDQGTNLTKEETMYLLARLLFRGDKAFNKIDNLSGGERNRVMLAKLVYTKANLLVLDEPTNHLDVLSIEVLEEALAAFKGTVLLVSHDRRLLSKVAHRIIQLNDGQTTSYPGRNGIKKINRE